MYTEERIEVFLKEKISKKSESIWMKQEQMSVECLMRNWKKHVKFLHFHPVAI